MTNEERRKAISKVCVAMHPYAGQPLDFFVVGAVIDAYEAARVEIEQARNKPHSVSVGVLKRDRLGHPDTGGFDI